MYYKMILKRVVFPMSYPAFASSVVAGSESKDEQEKKVLVRARDLSIYCKPAQQTNVQETEPADESALLSVVRQVREGLWSVTGQLTQVTDKVTHIIDTGKAHTSSTIQILRDEDNYAQRYGAIAVGGIVGYIVAIRRGLFRRLIYTATGATAVAAVCYPEEAKEYSSEGFREANHYIVIAYHFINGVLRDYVGVTLPSLPGPLDVSSAGPAAERVAPSSASLMPPPASAPSHIPLPPIDKPSFVSDSSKAKG